MELVKRSVSIGVAADGIQLRFREPDGAHAAAAELSLAREGDNLVPVASLAVHAAQAVGWDTSR